MREIPLKSWETKIGEFRITEKFGNQCCKDKPVEIIQTHGRDTDSYSCQCECGLWCTGGHWRVGEAVDEYMAMCESATLGRNIFVEPEVLASLEYTNRGQRK